MVENSDPKGKNILGEEMQPQVMATKEDPLIQYAVIRNDLGWPLGAIVSQGCHATNAAIAEGLRNNDAETQAYLSPENLPHMHKCVLGILRILCTCLECIRIAMELDYDITFRLSHTVIEKLLCVFIQV